MEERDRSRSPSRRTSRVEQVVGRWLRRSRDSSSRERILVDVKAGESSGSDQNHPIRLTVQILRDPLLNCHGLSLSPQTPILVQDVTPGGPADGRLVSGDQLVKINNVDVDDLTPKQAADIIRECQDSVTMTVLRHTMGPKSSFITPEKRAKLKSNPVKVRFAEEVEVNGHSQGNSLLFLPNVLKVYLENGQTKAFKFEPNTTVKDIVMTLKEKLSMSRIEHFSLVLEQQYSITKLLLLHDEEEIQQVVQRKEAHDYRCLFRVCFMPRDPQDLLQDDPTAFEYLYLQGVNDVLQERFAVEMRCNTALRLAALHILERLASCGQSPKTNLKIITKSWGIENFVSSTLLRNMREKDLRKAIGYHMKKSQSQLEPKQKVLSANQARINYLEELSELKSFGGKSFSATMMLQDRESMVTLLVGARYGVSQVVNHKLSIMTTLTEFSTITRIELLPESDRVSLVKMYLQDIKPITLLLESVAAKDLSCLVAGYCRLLVDSTINIFPWVDNAKKHRISTEEGYVSRCDSDSDDSSDIDMDTLITLVSPSNRRRSTSDPEQSSKGEKKGEKKERRERKEREEKDNNGGKKETHKKGEGEKEVEEVKKEEQRENERVEAGGEEAVKEENKRTEARGGGEGNERAEEEKGGVVEEHPSVSDASASDSCRTDSRFLTSVSSDSLDALEEDDLNACSSSSLHPHPHSSFRLTVEPLYPQGRTLSPVEGRGGHRREGDGADPNVSPTAVNFDPMINAVDPSDNFMCFAELSRMVDYLPSPPEASEEEGEEEEEEKKKRRAEAEVEAGSEEGGEGNSGRLPLSSSSSSRLDCVFNFEQRDTRCYYNICSNVTPDSARSLPRPHANSEKEEEEEQGAAGLDLEPVPILHPPPGFGDSSSEEEFFDAQDRFGSPEDPTLGAVPRDFSAKMMSKTVRSLSLSDIGICVAQQEREEKDGVRGQEMGRAGDIVSKLRRKSRKRRSFIQTDFTSRVSFPGPDPDQDRDLDWTKHRFRGRIAVADESQMLSSDPEPSEQTQNPCPTVSSLNHAEGEPAQLESKPILTKPSRQGASRGPGDPKGDLQRCSRTRQQDMEMEPDAMESKSVTALVNAASPSITITAVRCRVEPDGKESTDRWGDGEVREGEGAGEKEEEGGAVAGGSMKGPFTSHMFLPEIKGEVERGKETGDEIRGSSSNSEGPPIGAEGGPQISNSPPCLTKEEGESKNVSFRPHISVSPPSFDEEESEEDVTENIYPPEHAHPPPTSPLPPLPLPSITYTPYTEREECASCEMDVGMPTKPSSPCPEDSDGSCLTKTISQYTNKVDAAISDNDEATARISYITINADIATANIEPPASIHSVMANTDYATINQNSIMTNTEATSCVNSTAINTGSTVANVETPIGISATAKKVTANIEANSCTNSATVNVHELPKESPSPTSFLVQSCSPGVIGRLSASTLRGKIQSLPLYSSTLAQSGVGKAMNSHSTEVTRDETKVTIKITTDDGMDATALLFAESNDSEVTLTESEVDADIVVETTGAEITRSTVSEVKEVIEKVVMVYSSPPLPIRVEPKRNSQPLTPDSKMDSPGPKIDTSGTHTDPPEPKMDTPGPKMDAPGPTIEGPSPPIPPPKVVTTQSLNGPGLTFHNMAEHPIGGSIEKQSMGLCKSAGEDSGLLNTLTTGCGVFTICEAQPQTHPASYPPTKPDFRCSSVLASGCESVLEGVQALEACGCPAMYTNCFSGGDSFDDELTVYEFSCRMHSGPPKTSGVGLPLMTTLPPSSFLPTSPSPSLSPSFPRSVLPASSSTELSPLLSPLDPGNCFLSEAHEDAIVRLRHRRYPAPPAGFQILRSDVDQLQAILKGGSRGGRGGRHPRETCPTHFSENKRVLHVEARRLMAGCQKVVRVGQTPEEMLLSLTDSFRTLAGLAGVCLWFSGCDRCDKRNVEALVGLADVTRAYRDFVLAAERASGRRSCHDLSTKLLAKQCTALTASVFCLTQLFRTLTAL